MNNYNSTVNPFIVKCFEASTGHITKVDDILIKQTVHAYKEGDLDTTSLIVYPYEEGYFLFAAYDKDEKEFFYSSLEKEGYSQALIQLLRIAYLNGCKYLQLDADGIEYEDLPTFDW